jgi:hypothetical protein
MKLALPIKIKIIKIIIILAILFIQIIIFLILIIILNLHDPSLSRYSCNIRSKKLGCGSGCKVMS